MFSKVRSRTLVLIVTLLCFASRSEAATYYLSSSGRDSSDGLSPTTAWQTTGAINNRGFFPGDQILFAGGQTFNGGLAFAGGGTASSPIVLSSWGTNRATINAGSGHGLYAYDCAGLVVSNINFVGAGASVNQGSGIFFYADQPGNVVFPLITLANIEVSGFGQFGVAIGSWNNLTGYRDVSLLYVTAHDSLRGGIFTYAQMPFAHANFYIGYCQAYNNLGDPSASTHTGDGIILGGVAGGLIERCVAHDNGLNNRVTTQGPAGIWTYDSSNVVIQFNESHHNHTATMVDGDGFDLDIGVANSIMQYNYSHENDGAGYLLCCGADNHGNIVRYNISQNDSRRTGYGAIDTYGNVTDSEIHNNTIFLSQTNGNPKAVYLMTAATNLRFRNNVFHTTGGASLLWLAPGQTALLFQGNDYWSGGSPLSITDGGTVYSSFSSWQSATGRERIGGQPCGLNADPQFVLPGGGPAFNDAAVLGALAAYRLNPTSTLIDAGLSLPLLFGVNPGGQDFLGTAIPQAGGFDLGACELKWNPTLQFDSATYANGAFHLSALGPWGVTNFLESTTNFAEWSPVAVWMNTNGSWRYDDPVSASPGRFYRLRTE